MRQFMAALAAMLISLPVCSNELASAAHRILEGKETTVRLDLKGPMADHVRRITQSDAAVFAEVSAVKTFPQPTCKRLKVAITAPGALLKNAETGKTNPFFFTYRTAPQCSTNSGPAARAALRRSRPVWVEVKRRALTAVALVGGP